MSDKNDLLEEIRDLEREIDAVLEEKRQMQEQIDDLNKQLLQIQLLRNGDGHLIGDILRIANSSKDPSNAVEAIRNAINRWYRGGES